MKYYVFFQNLSLNIKKDFLNKIAFLTKPVTKEKQVIRNLFAEHFLSELRMEDNYKIIDGSKSIILDDILRQLKDYGYDYLLDGEQIKIAHKELLVGSVVPYKIFYDYLSLQHSKSFLYKSEIASFIDKLCFDKLLISDRHLDIQLQKKDRLIWCTWDIQNFNNPFDFLSTQFAEEARTALGLGHLSNERFIAFTYKIKTNYLYRPTIYDSGFNIHFRPAPPNLESHGRIHTLNNGKYQIKGKDYSLTPEAFNLPEAVIRGSNITVRNILECKYLTS